MQLFYCIYKLAFLLLIVVCCFNSIFVIKHCRRLCRARKADLEFQGEGLGLQPADLSLAERSVWVIIMGFLLSFRMISGHLIIRNCLSCPKVSYMGCFIYLPIDVKCHIVLLPCYCIIRQLLLTVELI